MLYFFPCCTFYMLPFLHIEKLSFCILGSFHVFFFRLPIFMLQLVALFSCYSFFMLHIHNIKKYWKWTKEKTWTEKRKGRNFLPFVIEKLSHLICISLISGSLLNTLFPLERNSFYFTVINVYDNSILILHFFGIWLSVKYKDFLIINHHH